MDKKDQLINTALELFYANGVSAVGINEILQVSGIAKKTLYNHFSSKDELVLATLRVRDQNIMRWLESKLQPSKNDKQLIEALFNALDAWFNNKNDELMPFRGCFFINTALDYSRHNDAIDNYCQQHKQNVRALIHNRLSKKNSHLSDAICILKDGAIVSAYVNKDLESAKKCISIALQLID